MEYKHKRNNLIFVLGLALITLGLVVLLDQFLRTGWLVLALIPGIGFVFLVAGILTRKISFIIPGSLILFTGLGLMAGLHWFSTYWFRVLGAALIGLATGWTAISLFSGLFTEKFYWWALIPAGAVASLSVIFMFTALRLLDFVFYLLTGIGIILLGVGIYQRLFGLIIPGCLLSGIGPGIYIAWARNIEPNRIAQTGQMLVWFALGWGLITLFSRVVTTKFIWWPLIPGGVLATVGWGLYIGGNPQNAVSFISNSGSVGIIIFGLYLLLLRRGIQR